MIYKILHRKTKIEQREGVNSGTPEGVGVPTPLVTPVELLLNDTDII